MKFTRESLRNLIVEEIGGLLSEATPKMSREDEEWLRANAKKGVANIEQHVADLEAELKAKYKRIATNMATSLQPHLRKAIYGAIVSDVGFLEDLRSSPSRVEKLYAMYAEEFAQGLVDALQRGVPDIIEGVVEDLYALLSDEEAEEDPEETAPALEPLDPGHTQLLEPR